MLGTVCVPAGRFICIKSTSDVRDNLGYFYSGIFIILSIEHFTGLSN